MNIFSKKSMRMALTLIIFLTYNFSVFAGGDWGIKPKNEPQKPETTEVASPPAETSKDDCPCCKDKTTKKVAKKIISKPCTNCAKTPAQDCTDKPIGGPVDLCTVDNFVYKNCACQGGVVRLHSKVTKKMWLVWMYAKTKTSRPKELHDILLECDLQKITISATINMVSPCTGLITQKNISGNRRVLVHPILGSILDMETMSPILSENNIVAEVPVEENPSPVIKTPPTEKEEEKEIVKPKKPSSKKGWWDNLFSSDSKKIQIERAQVGGSTESSNVPWYITLGLVFILFLIYILHKRMQGVEEKTTNHGTILTTVRDRVSKLEYLKEEFKELKKRMDDSMEIHGHLGTPEGSELRQKIQENIEQVKILEGS